MDEANLAPVLDVAFGGGFGELAVDADGVSDEHAGYGHCGVEVFIVAGEAAYFFAGVAEAERGGNHRDAEGDEA